MSAAATGIDGNCPRCGSFHVVAGDRPAAVCAACGSAFEAFVPSRAATRPPSGPAIVPVPAAGGSPRCAVHPNNAGGATCARCGGFMCAVCSTPVDAKVVCTGCAERMIENGEVVSAGGGASAPGAGGGRKPVTLRVDSAFGGLRLTLYEDRILVERRDPIVGAWSTDRTIFFDRIEVVYRFGRPVRLSLLGVLAAAPLVAVGVVAFPAPAAVVMLAIGALIAAASLYGGLAPQPWLRLRAGGVDLDLRENRPLLRPWRRRAFFRGLRASLGIRESP